MLVTLFYWMSRVMNDSMMDSMTSSSSSLLDLADYLGGNPEFCDAVRQRARHLDGTVQAAATLIGYEFSSAKECSRAFNALQARFGRVIMSPDRPRALQLQALL